MATCRKKKFASKNHLLSQLVGENKRYCRKYYRALYNECVQRDVFMCKLPGAALFNIKGF